MVKLGQREPIIEVGNLEPKRDYTPMFLISFVAIEKRFLMVKMEKLITSVLVKVRVCQNTSTSL